MFEKKAKLFIPCFLVFTFYFSLVLAVPVCWAGEPLDKTKYITVDEIVPGMEAYCLTAYRGTEVEKFDLEVLDVVHKIGPGKDAILVQGTDERFIHTGPVGGCSGSPVYINGRLAGALAFAAYFSKDPLYIVTPIEEMLRVGRTEDRGQRTEDRGRGLGYVFDFSGPIDFAEIYKQLTEPRYSMLNARYSMLGRAAGIERLPCPLITSGLPAGVCEQLGESVEPFGLMVVAGIGGGVNVDKDEDVQLAPGACLTVPLVTGDITMTVIGTVTEVVGDKVYGFGHSFLGSGPIDLPMATGKVHAVVSSVYRSFKFASPLEIVGALRADESTAVCGQIGAKAKMIPLTIKVDRYNDVEKRVYNCWVVNNQLLTPRMLGSAVAGAVLTLGDLPPNHMIEYKTVIGIEGFEPITLKNISTGLGINEMIIEGVASVAMLLNNPYKEVDIKSVDFDVRVVAKDVSSRIWSVDLSDSKVKAGEQIEVEVVVESVLAPKKRYVCSLRIPDELAPGKYDLIVCGARSYQQFLRKAAPYKFVHKNLPTLVEAMNNLLAIKRNKLYCLLALPSGGVAVEKAELPDLPATRALVLGDAKRALKIQPYPHWLENTLETGTVVVDKKVMRITVEE